MNQGIDSSSPAKCEKPTAAARAGIAYAHTVPPERPSPAHLHLPVRKGVAASVTCGMQTLNCGLPSLWPPTCHNPTWQYEGAPAAAGTDVHLACRPCEFKMPAPSQPHLGLWDGLLPAAAGTGAWHGQPEWPPPQGTGVHPHQPAEQAHHLRTRCPMRDALRCALSDLKCSWPITKPCALVSQAACMSARRADPSKTLRRLATIKQAAHHLRYTVSSSTQTQGSLQKLCLDSSCRCQPCAKTTSRTTM